jgi:hypothetical protein
MCFEKNGETLQAGSEVFVLASIVMDLEHMIEVHPILPATIEKYLRSGFQIAGFGLML